MLVYVNRELVDEQAGLKLVGRTEQTQSTRSQVNTEFRVDPHAPKATNAVKGSTSVTVGGNVTVVGDVKIDGVPITPGRGSISNRTDRVQNDNTYRVQERNPGAWPTNKPCGRRAPFTARCAWPVSRWPTSESPLQLIAANR